MARRRSASRQRDATHVATRPQVLSRPISTDLSSLRALQALRAHQLAKTQDLRTWHPQRMNRPLLTTRLGRASIRETTKRGKRPMAIGGLIRAFRAPRRVLVCLRRKVRREVLHALSRTGLGAKQRKRRRNQYSEIRC